MRILFLTDNFPPETNAPASRTYEHAKRWVKAGHEVTVVTGAPNFPIGRVFPGYRNRLRQTEDVDGIRVIRVWTYITANEGFLRRTLDYVSFMVSSIVASCFLRRPDVIVATSPQFFTAVAGYVVSRVKRRPWIFELRDLWPDSITAVGAMHDSLALKILKRLEYFLYRRADRIVSVTRSFKRILTENGIDPDRIAVVTNGVDLELYRPGPKPWALVDRLALADRFVAAYVGTIGMAHGLRALLDGAAILQDRPDIAFVLVGTGAERTALEAEARERGLDSVHFVGPVTKDEVRDYWRLADVALVLLRNTPLFAHVIPSKMCEAMGTGRPIVLGVRGESREILESAGAGIAVPPEDASALADAVRNLADDPARCAALGEAGRQHVSRHFDRDVLAGQMLDVLKDIGRRA